MYYWLHSATDVMTRILSRDTSSPGVQHTTTSVAYGNLLTILTLGSVMFASVKERSRFECSFDSTIASETKKFSLKRAQ